MTDHPDAYSFKVKVGHVAANPVTVKFVADARECARIAKIWDISKVFTFTGSAAVARWKRDGVRIKGHVEADIEQLCVVTLEPVRQFISEDFEALFVPENSKLARFDHHEGGEMILDPEGPDAPETFTGDAIDLGAVAAEFAALALDPYPRIEGAEFAAHIESEPTADDKKSPFAALKFPDSGSSDP